MAKARALVITPKGHTILLAIAAGLYKFRKYSKPYRARKKRRG